MTTNEARMREDWNKRAQHDALFWINTAHGRNLPQTKTVYENGKQQAPALLMPALRRFGFVPDRKCILEIGCGLGRLFPGFDAMGFGGIWGIDVSNEMVKRGRESCPVGRARFLLGNGYTFTGVPDDLAHYCFSYNVFQHLPQESILWRNMEEILRVLRPGGVFQIHLRARHPLKRRLLRMLPSNLRPGAQVAFRLATMHWVRGRPLRSRTIGSDDTWDLGAAVSPRRIMRRLEEMGFREVDILSDPTYPDGDRYWAIGRKDPAS